MQPGVVQANPLLPGSDPTLLCFTQAQEQRWYGKNPGPPYSSKTGKIHSNFTVDILQLQTVCMLCLPELSNEQLKAITNPNFCHCLLHWSCTFLYITFAVLYISPLKKSWRSQFSPDSSGKTQTQDMKQQKMKTVRLAYNFIKSTSEVIA